MYFGDTTERRLTITHLDERYRATGEAVFSNQHGDVVIEATTAGVVPGPAEQLVLRAMLAESNATDRR